MTKKNKSSVHFTFHSVTRTFARNVRLIIPSCRYIGSRPTFEYYLLLEGRGGGGGGGVFLGWGFFGGGEKGGGGGGGGGGGEALSLG